MNYEEILQKEFSQQITGSFDEWLKIKNKAVLIDDFHHRMKRQIFSYLSRTFSKVIISMNLDEYLVYFKDDASLASFSTLTLRPLTLARQEQLYAYPRKLICHLLFNSETSLGQTRIV